MNYSIQRVILNDFSTEGLFDNYKKLDRFYKLHKEIIKPIMYEIYKQKHPKMPEFVNKYNFDELYNSYWLQDAAKEFKKKLKENPNLDIEKYVKDLKKDMVGGNKPKSENNFFKKNKALFVKLTEKFVQANNEAIKKCKKLFDQEVNKLRKERNSMVNPNKTNEEIMDWLIEHKTSKDYLRIIEHEINAHNSDKGDIYWFSASIVDWRDIGDNFDDNNNFIRNWDDVWPLIGIIYNAWVDIAEKYAKSILGNRIVDIDDADGAYLEIRMK